MVLMQDATEGAKHQLLIIASAKEQVLFPDLIGNKKFMFACFKTIQYLSRSDSKLVLELLKYIKVDVGATADNHNNVRVLVQVGVSLGEKARGVGGRQCGTTRRLNKVAMVA